MDEQSVLREAREKARRDIQDQLTDLGVPFKPYPFPGLPENVIRILVPDWVDRVHLVGYLYNDDRLFSQNFYFPFQQVLLGGYRYQVIEYRV